MTNLLKDEEFSGALTEILKACEKEDHELRAAKVKEWQKYEMFWHGFQHLFWSDRDETWISTGDAGWQDRIAAELEDDDVEEFYDYVIDIFTSHGESIIAALSAQLPVVRFLPDDADVEMDVLTAKTYNKIVDLLYRHNNAKLVFIKSLFYIYIAGIVFSYLYKDTSEDYGTNEVSKYGTEEVEEPFNTCGDCGSEDVVEGYCTACGSDNIIQGTRPKTNPIKIDTVQEPKSRAKMDVFGPLHVKIPFLVRKPEEVNYLILYTDQYKSEVKAALDPDEELEGIIEAEHVADTDRTEHLEYTGDDAQDKLTVIRLWLTPDRYWMAPEDHRKTLFKNYPRGCHIEFIGNSRIPTIIEEERLKDRWNIGVGGLSTFIHADARCRPIVPVQELRNELINMTEDTIEHSIPTEFADPSALNFDQYGKFSALPGNIYKASMRGNQPLGNSFYSTTRATLSKDAPTFQKSLDQDAQFVTGSFPSIYGGPSEGKSRTFSEYAASRQMALQRLTIVWTYVVDFWQRTMHSLVNLYTNIMVEDERFVTRDGNNYMNVWIRRSELKGKIGGVEPESSDSFPVSLIQKRDMIEKFIELNNDYINSVLYTPRNAKVIQDTLAFDELEIPGEGQRSKQIMEISEMIGADPIMQGQMILPSVQIEPEIDDDEAHIDTLIGYLVQPEGLDLRKNDNKSYENLKAHLRMHQMSLMQKTMTQTDTPPGESPDTTAAEPEA